MVNLKGNLAYVFKYQNGWIKFYNKIIVRWNTTWYSGEYVFFNIVKMK